MRFKSFCLIAFLIEMLPTNAILGETIGIVGGLTTAGISPPMKYVALLDSNLSTSSLTLTQIPLSPTLGVISDVAMNALGFSLIAGSGPPAFIALVSPSGSITPLSGGGVSSASNFSVAMSGLSGGLVGGATGANMYAGKVSLDGTVMQLPLTQPGLIGAVAINDTEMGLVAGRDGSTFPFAALVTPDGGIIPVSGLPQQAGAVIDAASLNEQGLGLFGGATASQSFAAFVFPNATATQILGLPMGGGSTITSVALNDSGVGLVGGFDRVAATDRAYAALVLPDGTVTPLSGDNFPTAVGSRINGVAINSSGQGLIGGTSATNGPAYAAIVAKDGSLIQLSSPFLTIPGSVSTITSVALNDAGVGLLGGSTGNVGADLPVAALVAPNGTVTELFLGNFDANSQIRSVALIDVISPDFLMSYVSPVYMQLAAMDALQTHLTTQSRVGKIGPSSNQEVSLLAGGLPHSTPSACGANQRKEPDFTFWLTPFGDIIHQKAHNHNPSLRNTIGGALLGFDYQSSHWLFGAGLGYAFDYLHYGSGVGHGNVQEEMACFYGAFQDKYVRVNFGFWGGLYQFGNERHTLTILTSKAHTHGWVAAPHLEVSTPIEQSQILAIEPFIMFDWVNSWQDPFTEKGPSGFNLVLHRHYGSLLRSELGLRLYEVWAFSFGQFLFQQKASYIRQDPFHFDAVSTSFVASAFSFPVAIGSTAGQNLAGVAVRGTFEPSNQRYPYLTVSAQGDLGTSYQSYFAELEIGKRF